MILVIPAVLMAVFGSPPAQSSSSPPQPPLQIISIANGFLWIIQRFKFVVEIFINNGMLEIMKIIKQLGVATLLLLISASLVFATKDRENHGRKMKKGSKFNNHGKAYPHVVVSDDTSVEFLHSAIAFSIAESIGEAASDEEIEELAETIGNSGYLEYSRSLAQTLSFLSAGEQAYIFSGK